MVVEISEGPPGGSKDGGNARDVLVRGSLARQIGDLSADLVARDHLVAVDVAQFCECSADGNVSNLRVREFAS